MDNFEEILELLQKEELNEEKSDRLSSLISGDIEAQKFCDIYKKTEKAVKIFSHLTIGEISGYVLYKNNPANVDNETTKLAPRIEFHLRLCKKCGSKFKLLNEEYNETEIFISNISNDNKANEKPGGIFKNISSGLFASRYGFLTTVAILICVSIIIISRISAPQYYGLAEIKDKTEISFSRGRGSIEFMEGLRFLDENEYDEAIKYFDGDIVSNKNDETIFYSYYIVGITYLESAGKDVLGLFPSYDKDRVTMGIINLHECIQRNTSGKFPNINLNAYYYLAKANLMLGNKAKAIEYLNNVIEGKGSKMDEASRMLNELR